MTSSGRRSWRATWSPSGACRTSSGRSRTRRRPARCSSGRSVTQHKQVSDVTAHAIDEEVRSVIETNYQWASRSWPTQLDKLHAMAEALIRYETIDEEQLKDIMDGRPPKPPAGWDETLSNRPPRAPAEGRAGPGTAIGPPAGSTRAEYLRATRTREAFGRPAHVRATSACSDFVPSRHGSLPVTSSRRISSSRSWACSMSRLIPSRMAAAMSAHASRGACRGEAGAAIIDIGGESTRPGRGP